VELPKGLVIGPLQLAVYINDLPVGINALLEPIIYADGTGIIVSVKIVDDFCAVLNVVISHWSKWFGASKFDLMWMK
jgi:hypothetical protein